jgi:hypothetical protein
MAISFRKVDEVSKEASNGYDIWELSNNFGSNPGVVGWYFVPVDTDGKEYHDALRTAEQKLIALGLTEIEVKAIMGRQLF